MLKKLILTAKQAREEANTRKLIKSDLDKCQREIDKGIFNGDYSIFINNEDFNNYTELVKSLHEFGYHTSAYGQRTEINW